MERTYKNRCDDRIELSESDSSLNLFFDERSEVTVYIRMENEAEKVRLYLKAKPYCDVRVLVQNCSSKNAELEIDSDVDRDALIKVGILDLEQKAMKTRLDGQLNEEGATMEVWSGQLCLKDAPKKNDYNVVSHHPHTYGMMHNFAVCFDEGVYDMAAAGRIDKGCYGSESHQETRVLTLGKDHKTCVIPILYIDENDVKASHALTVGQPDASQLYYLESRGLNARQAMGLLAIGYFKPVTELLGDETLKDALQQEIEQKAGLYEY